MTTEAQILEETAAHLQNAEVNVRRQLNISSGTIGRELIGHITSAQRLVELQIRRLE